MNIYDKFDQKDRKVIFENFISLASIQVFGILIPLVTLPYILRTIGFEKYGLIIFAGTLIAYFQALTDFSFKITAVREVAIFKNSTQKLSLIYSKVITVQLIFLLLSVLILTSIIYLYPPFFENRIVYFFSMLSLLGNIIFPEWFFQGIEKMKIVTIFNLIIKLFFAGCVFFFIKKPSDFWLYPLFQGTGYIVAGVAAQYLLVKKYKLKFKLLKTRMLILTIKKNYPIFINQFIPTLYNNTSLFLLGIFESRVILGIFQAILTLVNFANIILDVFSRVFFPFLNRKKDAFNSFKSIMYLILSLIVFGVLIGYKVLFWYLNIEYNKAVYILLILLIGVIGYGFYNIYGLNYFIVRREDKLVMKNTFKYSIVGFIFALPLIYFFGIFGAAINLTISRTLIGFNLYFIYKKKKNEYII